VLSVWRCACTEGRRRVRSAACRRRTYYDWLLDRAYLLIPAQEYVGRFLQTFKDHPPRMKAASFSLGDVMEKMSNPGTH
jgi:arylsulfatase